MTKKDYMGIAQTLEKMDFIKFEDYVKMVERLCSLFGSDNLRFNDLRFMNSCGIAVNSGIYEDIREQSRKS